MRRLGFGRTQIDFACPQSVQVGNRHHREHEGCDTQRWPDEGRVSTHIQKSCNVFHVSKSVPVRRVARRDENTVPFLARGHHLAQPVRLHIDVAHFG